MITFKPIVRIKFIFHPQKKQKQKTTAFRFTLKISGKDVRNSGIFRNYNLDSGIGMPIFVIPELRTELQKIIISKRRHCGNLVCGNSGISGNFKYPNSEDKIGLRKLRSIVRSGWFRSSLCSKGVLDSIPRREEFNVLESALKHIPRTWTLFISDGKQ